MENMHWKEKIQSFDLRRDVIIPGQEKETILFCVEQLLEIGKNAIQKKGVFTLALSGGHTPNAIFKELSQSKYQHALDWGKVLCFWSDERSVPPNDKESNYLNAMEAGLKNLPLNPAHIFRMKAEHDIEENALAYEELIRAKVPSLQFDLIQLGMGEDGHTASLFPHTHGLHTKDRLITANYVPEKATWRMSMTYECLHMAHAISIYVIGARKAPMVKRALLGPYDPDLLPVQRVGTPSHKALWILDEAAGQELVECL